MLLVWTLFRFVGWWLLLRWLGLVWHFLRLRGARLRRARHCVFPYSPFPGATTTHHHALPTTLPTPAVVLPSLGWTSSPSLNLLPPLTFCLTTLLLNTHGFRFYLVFVLIFNRYDIQCCVYILPLYPPLTYLTTLPPFTTPRFCSATILILFNLCSDNSILPVHLCHPHMLYPTIPMPRVNSMPAFCALWRDSLRALPSVNLCGVIYPPNLRWLFRLIRYAYRDFG